MVEPWIISIYDFLAPGSRIGSFWGCHIRRAGSSATFPARCLLSPAFLGGTMGSFPRIPGNETAQRQRFHVGRFCVPDFNGRYRLWKHRLQQLRLLEVTK